MGGGFDGAPVVAGGDGHGVHAVHDALVVGGGPVGIDLRQVAGQHHAIAHLLTGVALALQISRRDANAGAG